MPTVLALVVAAAVAAVAVRHLQARWRTGQLDDTVVQAWRRLWPSAPLTWAQVERRALRRILASVSTGVAGQTLVPSRLEVHLSPADHELVGGARSAIERNLALALRSRAVEKGWTLTGGPVVALVADPDAFDGAPRVEPSFAVTDPPVSPADHATGPGPARPGTAGDATAADEEATGSTAVEPAPGVVEVPPALHLVAPDGRRTPLARHGRALTLGRGPEADVVVPDPVVSGRHAALVAAGGRWRVEDLGSRNGTWLNGRRLEAGPAHAAVLGHGDEVGLGRRGPRLRVEGAVAGPASPPGPAAPERTQVAPTPV